MLSPFLYLSLQPRYSTLPVPPPTDKTSVACPLQPLDDNAPVLKFFFLQKDSLYTEIKKKSPFFLRKVLKPRQFSKVSFFLLFVCYLMSPSDHRETADVQVFALVWCRALLHKNRGTHQCCSLPPLKPLGQKVSTPHRSFSPCSHAATVTPATIQRKGTGGGRRRGVRKNWRGVWRREIAG